MPTLPWDRLPPRPSLSVANVSVPPGATKAHIRLVASGPIMATATATLFVSGGPSTSFNTGDGAGWAPRFAVVWRPGDSPEHWVTIDILKPDTRIGAAFKVNIVPEGFASAAWLSCLVTVAVGAVNALPATMPFHRPPKRLDLRTSVPAASQCMKCIDWSDTGFVGNAASGTPCWRSRLAHGYSQPGNAEPGAYLNSDAFPAQAVRPHAKEVDGHGRPFVRLHTQKLPTPVQVGSEQLPYQAAVLTTQRLPQFNQRRGLWRAQIVSPDRPGAWSAFWMIGRDPATSGAIWPPEVDIMEQFNGAYGAAYYPDTTSSCQHVGSHGTGTRAKVDGMGVRMTKLGFADLDFFREIHEHACIVDDDWTWYFIDGIETFCHPTMTDREDGGTNYDFFMMLNVAVKPPAGGEAYDQGSGDMLIYGIQMHRAGSGYALVDFTEPRPWANRKVLPDPTEAFPPRVTTPVTTSVGEGREGRFQLSASQPVTWALEPGGTDNAQVSVSSAGVVTLAPRDFEAPSDTNRDSQYEYRVRATEASGRSVTQTRRVAVVDRPDGLPPQQLTPAQAALAVGPGNWELRGGWTLKPASDGWFRLSGSGTGGPVGMRVNWTLNPSLAAPYDAMTYAIEVRNDTTAPITARLFGAWDVPLANGGLHTVNPGETKLVQGLMTLMWERTFMVVGSGLLVRAPAVRPRWT